MANTFINPTAVARRALKQLENNCIMANKVYRGYEDEFKTSFNGWKKGSSITIKTPVYFRVKDGATIDTVELREEDTTFTLAYRKHVAFPVTSAEMTYNIDKFQERFIVPAMQALGNYIDRASLGLYAGVPMQVGTPGTTPSDFYTFAQAGAYLSDMATPMSDRYCVIDPWAQAKLADSIKGVFHSPMVANAVQMGRISDSFAGMEMYMSQNVNSHTCGTAAGATDILVDGAASEGDNTITIDQNGSWTKTLTQGDIFTVGSVNAVNPISGDSTGYLRQFVVETAAGTTGNETAVDCSPGKDPYALYSASATEKQLPYQNVDALPGNNAAVTVAGSSGLNHKVNLAFHRHALGLCMVPLEMPASVSWGARESYKGYSIRVIRDYDVINDQEYIRFDTLFGLKVLNPMMACRIAG